MVRSYRWDVRIRSNPSQAADINHAANFSERAGSSSGDGQAWSEAIDGMYESARSVLHTQRIRWKA